MQIKDLFSEIVSNWRGELTPQYMHLFHSRNVYPLIAIADRGEAYFYLFCQVNSGI